MRVFRYVLGGFAIIFVASTHSALSAHPASDPAARIWHGIESRGWPSALRSFQVRFQSDRSYLALYNKIPRRPIDMRSADRFKQNMSAHEFAGKSSIGHMAIGWSCATSNSPTHNGVDGRIEGFAAQTGEDGQQSEMLKNGWGVTALVSTFTDGRIQNGDDLEKYFAQTNTAQEIGQTDDTFFALVVEVPSTDCESVREFVKTYVLHPTKPHRNFGLVPDPLKFEGGGCGSFAVAALSNAPTVAPLVENYWRTIPLAKKLLGRRTRVHLPNDVVPFVFAKTANDEYEINKFQLILMNWDFGETALDLRLVDPELAIFSFRRLAEIAAKNSPSPVHYQTYQNSLKRFFYFANTASEASRTSKDAGVQEINDAFDVSFNQVANSVNKWWQTRRRDSQIQFVELPQGTGVMIDSTNVIRH